MRSIRLVTAMVLAIACCLPSLIAQVIKISGEVGDDQQAKISFHLSDEPVGGELTLFRSTRPISPDDLNAVRYPISAFRISDSELASGFIDFHAAHNITYHYVASMDRGDDGTKFSNVISVSLSDVLLPALLKPEILIDKIHYMLEVWDGGEVVKRFPVILGRDPIVRKLNQDFQTTPEGIYLITNLKRNSTFHRAFDIDYPSRIDRIRYDFLRSQGRIPPGKSIGGEIQFHGQLRNRALERNWTWGCIALRNADIEELFDHPDIHVGTPVFIVGTEITREDLISLRKDRSVAEISSIQTRLRELGLYPGEMDGILGRQTRIALGKFQLDKGFPVTCDLDERTTGSLFD
ncbi:MAG: L,D-transpeptidase family protein [Candidatus Aminicenantaceae bacterium]